MKENIFFLTLLSAVVVALSMSCGPGEKPSSGKPGMSPPIFEKSGDVTLGAKSSYTESLSPLKFFDKDPGTFWHSGNPAGDYGWISISFSKPYKAHGYTITRRSEDSSQAPVDFVLEGSTSQVFPDAESKWKVIEEVRDQKWAVTKQTYKIKNPDNYVHYRLRIVKTVSDQNNTSVAEWELK